MKRKTNKAKEEAWSQTAHAPDGEQPGPETSGTSGQSVPKSKFRKKSQQERAAAAKLRMESQGEKAGTGPGEAGKAKAAEKARPGETHRPCCQWFRSQLRAWQNF